MSIVQLHVAYITDYINNYAAWANIHIVSFMKVLACNRDFCQQMSLPVRRKYRACIHVNNLYLPASGIDKVNKSIKYKLKKNSLINGKDTSTQRQHKLLQRIVTQMLPLYSQL